MKFLESYQPSLAPVLKLIGPRPLLATFFVIVAWLVARQPLYDLPFVFWQPDSGSYFLNAAAIVQGNLPDTTIRPPAYSMLLAPWIMLGGGHSIVVAQSLIFLAASLTLLYALAGLLGGRWLMAASGIVVIVLSPWGMEHEFSLMADSLLASMMILATAFALIGLQREASAGWFALAGLCAGLALLAKPAGLALLVTMALLAAYLALRRRWRSAGLVLAIPIAFITVLSIYNGVTNDVWRYTDFVGRNLLSATCTTAVLEAEPPGEARDGLLILHSRVPPEDWQAFAGWRPFAHAEASMRWFDQCGMSIFFKMSNAELHETGKRFLAQNPAGYAKRVLMIAGAYHQRVYKQRKFLTLINKGIIPVMADAQAIMRRHCGPTSELPADAGAVICPEPELLSAPIPHALVHEAAMRIVLKVQGVDGLWPLLLWLAAALWGFASWRRRRLLLPFVAALLLLTTELTSAVLIGLSQNASPRYTGATEFCLYAALGLLLAAIAMRAWRRDGPADTIQPAPALR